MPRVKKVPIKKSSKFVATKPHSKKHTKSNKEDASLHQAFVSSLVTLESYWTKKASNLKKQLDSLRIKLEKTIQKQKAAKAKSSAAKRHLSAKQAVDVLQAQMSETRDALAQAKLGASKYVALSKIIEQFEADWLKKLAKSSPQIKADHHLVEKKTKKASKAAGKKRGRKPKAKDLDAQTTLLPHEEDLVSFSDESSEKHLSPKKRGRKPKVKEVAPATTSISPTYTEKEPFSLEEDIFEELLQDEAEDDEMFVPLEDFESELRIEDSLDRLDDDTFEDFNS